MNALRSLTARLALAGPALAVLLVLALWGAEAAARVGGGQGYSGGSSGGSRSSGGSLSGGGSGGGGGGGEILWLWIRFCLAYPAIGLPMTVVVGGGAFYWYTQHHGGRSYSHHGRGDLNHAATAAPTTTGLDELLARDPNFSEPLLIDLVQLIYARAQELRGANRPEPLAEWLGPDALQQLFDARGDLSEVGQVVFGATRLRRAWKEGGFDRVEVDLETNLTEVRAGKDVHLHRIERWVLARRVGVTSPGPDRMTVLGCAQCGSTLDPKTDGTCPNCDSVRTGGANQWTVVGISVTRNAPPSAPPLSLGGGVEPGTTLPTRTDPNLAAQRRRFEARHPDHDWARFRGRVEKIFLLLQASWADGTWEGARPYETDALFGTHRFWIERYARSGLANRITEAQITDVKLVRIGSDAWYETVTVRVFASMLDWTEKTSGADKGKIVGGSKSEKRSFSEYWTFLRTTGGKHRSDSEWSPETCPSCGAPTDKVNMAGVCGYCDAKITSGAFDWVLSRIEQDEAWRG